MAGKSPAGRPLKQTPKGKSGRGRRDRGRQSKAAKAAAGKSKRGRGRTPTGRPRGRPKSVPPHPMVSAALSTRVGVKLEPTVDAVDDSAPAIDLATIPPKRAIGLATIPLKRAVITKKAELPDVWNTITLHDGTEVKMRSNTVGNDYFCPAETDEELLIDQLPPDIEAWLNRTDADCSYGRGPAYATGPMPPYTTERFNMRAARVERPTTTPVATTATAAATAAASGPGAMHVPAVASPTPTGRPASRSRRSVILINAADKNDTRIYESGAVAARDIGISESHFSTSRNKDNAVQGREDKCWFIADCPAEDVAVPQLPPAANLPKTKLQVKVFKAPKAVPRVVPKAVAKVQPKPTVVEEAPKKMSRTEEKKAKAAAKNAERVKERDPKVPPKSAKPAGLFDPRQIKPGGPKRPVLITSAKDPTVTWMFESGNSAATFVGMSESTLSTAKRTKAVLNGWLVCNMTKEMIDAAAARPLTPPHTVDTPTKHGASRPVWLINAEDRSKRMIFNTAKKASDFILVSQSTLCHARNTEKALNGWYVTDAQDKLGPTVPSSPTVKRLIAKQKVKEVPKQKVKEVPKKDSKKDPKADKTLADKTEQRSVAAINGWKLKKEKEAKADKEAAKADKEAQKEAKREAKKEAKKEALKETLKEAKKEAKKEALKEALKQAAEKEAKKQAKKQAKKEIKKRKGAPLSYGDGPKSMRAIPLVLRTQGRKACNCKRRACNTCHQCEHCGCQCPGMKQSANRNPSRRQKFSKYDADDFVTGNEAIRKVLEKQTVMEEGASSRKLSATKVLPEDATAPSVAVVGPRKRRGRLPTAAEQPYVSSSMVAQSTRGEPQSTGKNPSTAAPKQLKPKQPLKGAAKMAQAAKAARDERAGTPSKRRGRPPKNKTAGVGAAPRENKKPRRCARGTEPNAAPVVLTRPKRSHRKRADPTVDAYNSANTPQFPPAMGAMVVADDM